MVLFCYSSVKVDLFFNNICNAIRNTTEKAPGYSRQNTICLIC